MADISSPQGDARAHLERLIATLPGLDISRTASWGRLLAGQLRSGHRILVAGNGGSAAEAQHFAAELVGRFQHERQAMSAIVLHADTSTVTAVANDYGFDEVFARQVRAHGRAGDILLVLSASGRSQNLCRAVTAARELGMVTWALTGPGPNPLAGLADDAIVVDSSAVATVQECHLVAIHMLAMMVDRTLAADPAPGEQAEITPAPGSPVPQSPARPRARPGPGGRRARLVIIGDTLLDRDRTGLVKRLSPEAPVPVVSDVRVVSRPGGAGLAALMAALGGGDTALITALGADPAAAELRALLTAAGVAIIDLGLAGPTPVKSRVRAADRTLLMIDESEVPAGVDGVLPDEAQDALRAADGVLVSDYGRGLAAAAPVRAALAGLLARTPVVWDPHPRGPAPVPGVRMATPNCREAAALAGTHDGQGLLADIVSARALVDRWGAKQVAVTRGSLGAVLVQDAHSAPLVVNARTSWSSDSCGAGDRFAVAVTTMLATGMLPSAAVIEAVALASAYVAAGGPAGLGGEGPGPRPADGGRRDPLEVAQQVRAAGGTVVATGGCFDLLHTGHVHMLDEARRLGDCLIVCLNSDDSVARLKGAPRPIVSAADREATLLALRSVDAVLTFDEHTPERVLRLLQPHIFVKGGDYSMADLPEAAVLRSWNGQVVVVPYLAGRSTTSLIRDMVE